jgi:plastocyanin
LTRTRQFLIPALCLTTAACGGSSSSPAPSPSPRPVVRVVMRRIRFMPHEVTARVGQTVRWDNRDGVPHTVASQALGLSSEAIPPAGTYTYTADRPGSFGYYCTIHAGQTGVLVVRR